MKIVLDYVKELMSPRNPLRLFYHKLLAVAACVRYGFPARRLKVIGITGTKGKTTTTNLVEKILREAGYKVGMMSTINFRVNDRAWVNKSKQTSASPFMAQRLLREMVNEGCEFVVMEVSSHAITQSRVWGINFDTAVLTNMIGDHIEYHGSFEEYLRTKGLLFAGLNRSARKPNVPKVSILNKDEPHFSYFDQFIVDRKYTYGIGEGTVFATDVAYSPEGAKVTMNAPNAKTEIMLRLPGEVNVYNALAAATVALAHNINFSVIKAGLEKAHQIPGRFEHINCGQSYSVIVDYAHTPESLEQLCAMYRGLTKGRLFLVFGATGGGRDKSKRPQMGEVAAKYADYIVVTSDDPYSENEMEIIDQVATGINRPEGEYFWKMPHRREAIRLALTLARQGDVVLIAGKGCEEIQCIGGKQIPWDDRKVVRELLSRDIEVEIGGGAVEPRPNVCLES